MKLLFLLLTLLSYAAVSHAATPNAFSCEGTSGEESFSIDYTSQRGSNTDFLLLSISDSSVQSFTVSDQDIKHSQGIFGKMVGVIIERGSGVFESWSLAIPKISLRSVYNKAYFNSIIVKGIEVDQIGSKPNYRQSKSYLKNLQYINVKCIAKLVVN